MQQVLHDPTVLPENLPAPVDDGATRHLAGARMPDVALTATDGTLTSTTSASFSVYAYSLVAGNLATSGTSITSRVVPGVAVTMAASRPTRAFRSVLFPAFGAPTRAIR